MLWKEFERETVTYVLWYYMTGKVKLISFGNTDLADTEGRHYQSPNAFCLSLQRLVA